MNSLLINCRLFKINSYNLTECWCLCVLSPRPWMSGPRGRWAGGDVGCAVAVPSPSRNALKDVAHPCLAGIVLHPPWWPLRFPCRHSSQVALSWEEPCPRQQRAGAGGAVTPELLFLVSLLPFIQPQPSAQGRMEGEQLLLHGWARTRVMRLMDAFSSLAVGAALAWCSLGIVEHTQPWLPCKHLPVTPKLGWAPRPPRGAMGSGSAS